MKLDVSSEIGPLQAVMLHRPGEELERLMPEYLEDLLFDEIPWLQRAQVEHDGFAQALEKCDAQVFYLQELVKEICTQEGVKARLIQEHLNYSQLTNTALQEEVQGHLLALPCDQTIHILVAGLPKDELPNPKQGPTLSDLTANSYPFHLNPMPSMYFTRDHGALIGSQLLVSAMANRARRRETIWLRFLYQYHPLFQDCDLLLDGELSSGIEGGDILVPTKKKLIIGLSERTREEAVEFIAHRLFANSVIEGILVLQIPSRRSYMHLDTVFTMVDYDKFLIYPGVEKEINVFSLYPGKEGPLARCHDNLSQALADFLDLPQVLLIRSGGDNPITAAREQWGDSTNTLAVAPGVVITYNRNTKTNELLNKYGVDIIEIEGSELVRGRGGPRCMSMPLSRGPI